MAVNKPNYAYSPLQNSEANLTPSTRRRSKSILVRVLVSFILIMVTVSLARHTTLGQRVLAACHRRPKSSPAANKLPTHYTLPSGDRIPSVALGTAGKGEVGQAVKAALKTGYRHIDDAWIYRNEAEVGQAIKASGVNRSDIFITSKLWNTFHRPSDVESALDDSLTKLGISYLDLYLIHWPVAFVPDPNSPDKDSKKTADGKPLVDRDLTRDEVQTWKALEAVVKKGKVRNIGVSNFNIRKLQNLTQSGISIQPAVNQVELNFWNPQPELVKWAKDNNILLEAYSPLGGKNQVKKSLNVPEVKEVAKDLGITPAQVLISWAVQRGVIVLPKSVNPPRIEENLQVTFLPQAAFDKIEKAALSHPPKRTLNPSKGWGIDDVFEDE